MLQRALPSLSRLVKHIRGFFEVLHDVFHDQSLVPLDGQIQPLDLDQDIEKVKELRRVVLVLRREADYFLDLLRMYLQACCLICYEHLQKSYTKCLKIK